MVKKEFKSEENYNAALSNGSFTVYERFVNEDGYNDQRSTDLSAPTYSELQDKVQSVVDSITIEKDTIIFEAGSFYFHLTKCWSFLFRNPSVVKSNSC